MQFKRRNESKIVSSTASTISELHMQENSIRSVIICEVSSGSLRSPSISHAFCTVIMTIAVRSEYGFLTSSSLNSCNYLFLTIVWKGKKKKKTDFQGCLVTWLDCKLHRVPIKFQVQFKMISRIVWLYG